MYDNNNNNNNNNNRPNSRLDRVDCDEDETKNEAYFR